MKKWLMLLCAALCACTLQKKFRDPLTERSQDELKSDLLSTPTFQSLSKSDDAPSKPSASLDPFPAAFKKKVTIEINESQPIKKVFLELCQAADINISVEKNVEGSLFFRSKNRPILEVIDALCRMLNLRFRYEHDLLIIEKDTPYLKTYNLQFLNVTRETKNSVSITNNILSKSATSGAGSNGSTTEISSRADNDFWYELKGILQNILQISKAQNADEDSEKVEEKHIQNPSPAPKSAQDHKVTVRERKKTKHSKAPSFAIHRQAGLITVFGTQKNHTVVESFLILLKKQMKAQILIEAKVLEVTLKEEYKSGIDWQRIGSYNLGEYKAVNTSGFSGDLHAAALFGQAAQKTSALITTPETSQVMSIGGRGASLSAILNFMETFGVVRTLSSPRLTVLNNQTALLKVAENFVFFNVTGERQFLNADNANYGSLVSANSSPQTIPIGFVMNVQPSIDLETRDIIINLRPTITRLIDRKQDPAVVLMNQSLRNPSEHIQAEFPVIAVREMDSILRISSGSVVILGGLMIEGAETGRAGVPGMGEGPFSFLTSSKRRAKAVTELVIFLRATILDHPEPDAKDQELYKSFSLDTRPLAWKPLS